MKPFDATDVTAEGLAAANSQPLNRRSGPIVQTQRHRSERWLKLSKVHVPRWRTIDCIGASPKRLFRRLACAMLAFQCASVMGADATRTTCPLTNADKPTANAIALIAISPAGPPRLPGRYAVLCEKQIGDRKKDKPAKFGIHLNPGERDDWNGIRYNLPPRVWGQLRVRLAHYDPVDDQNGAACYGGGAASFHVDGFYGEREIALLKGTWVKQLEVLEQSISLPLDAQGEAVTAIRFRVFTSHADGRTHCNTAIYADAWLIPAEDVRATSK